MKYYHKINLWCGQKEFLHGIITLFFGKSLHLGEGSKLRQYLSPKQLTVIFIIIQATFSVTVYLLHYLQVTFAMLNNELMERFFRFFL